MYEGYSMLFRGGGGGFRKEEDDMYNIYKRSS